MSSNSPSPVKVSESTRSQLPKVQGLLQVDRGESITLGEAVVVSLRDFLDDPPQEYDEGRLRLLIEEREEEGSKAVKLPNGGTALVNRVRGHIQFKTGINVANNEAVRVAVDRYLENSDIPS